MFVPRLFEKDVVLAVRYIDECHVREGSKVPESPSITYYIPSHLFWMRGNVMRKAIEPGSCIEFPRTTQSLL